MTEPQSDPRFLTTETPAGSLTVDPALGNIRHLAFHADDRVIAPLHAAPWIEEPESDALPLAPVERHLSGDFFCAPFGANDLDGAPIHGWSANSPWALLDRGAGSLAFRLERPVMGARIEKTLRLAPDAPLLYQRHEIAGGEGGLTVAHHPMLRMAEGGRIDVSPKRFAMTPELPLVPGRNRLACADETRDLAHVLTSRGDTCDLHRFPPGERNEDFITLVEADDSPLGWTAVIREAEDDIVFVLKNPAQLPVTMLWISNGGRDFPPWNGRHRGVLGIEDGCAAGAGGHRAALGENPLAARGVRTRIDLGPGRRHRIDHVIGAVPRPAGWTEIGGIAISGDRLTLSEAGGESLDLPFQAGFFDA